MTRKFHRDLLLLLLPIMVLPQIILSLDEQIDPFTFSSVGLAQTWSQEGKVILYPYSPSSPGTWQEHANGISVRVVPTLLLVILNQVTGISLWRLLFLPITGLISVLLAYTFSRNLSQSLVVAMLFTLAFSYELSLTRFFNIYYISVGLTLFWVFSIIWLRFTGPQRTRRIYLVLLSIIFVALYFSYYTAEFLALSLLFAALSISWVFKRITNIRVSKPRLLALSLSFLIIFIHFDSVFYYFLQTASLENVQKTFSSYLNYAYRFLTVGERAISEYRPQIGNPLLVYTEFFQRVLIGLSLGAYFLYLIKKFRREQIVLTPRGLVFLSLFTVGSLHMLIYLAMGYPYFLILFWISLLATLFSLNKLRTEIKRSKMRIIGSILITMMLLTASTSVVKFVALLEDPVTPHGFRLHSSMKAGTSWAALHIPEGHVVADLRIAGQLFMEVVAVGKAGHIYPYKLGDEVQYLYSLDPKAPYRIFEKSESSYLVLSYEFVKRSFYAGEMWEYTPPLASALSFLNHYPSLDKVYDDGNGLIYRYNPK